jgi:predicted transcriptional regulator
MLGVTEPAVTQYKLKKSKRSRGDQIQIPTELMSDLEASADLIVKSWNETKEESSVYEIMTREFNRLIEVLRDAGVLCDIHREHCIHVKEDCAACN